jgi:putative flippase GtrA
MREFRSKFLPYMLTGGIAAVVDAGGFAVLVNAKLGIAAAGIISFCIAALVNYGLTSRFVFNRPSTLHGFMLFFSGALIGLSTNVGITLIGVFVFWLPPLVAKLVGIALAFLLNFLINLHIVFRARG